LLNKIFLKKIFGFAEKLYDIDYQNDSHDFKDFNKKFSSVLLEYLEASLLEYNEEIIEEYLLFIRRHHTNFFLNYKLLKVIYKIEYRGKLVLLLTLLEIFIMVLIKNEKLCDFILYLSEVVFFLEIVQYDCKHKKCIYNT
jgi:hypothetical protein